MAGRLAVMEEGLHKVGSTAEFECKYVVQCITLHCIALRMALEDVPEGTRVAVK
jgi:uncharacterized protein (DUF305 family)